MKRFLILVFYTLTAAAMQPVGTPDQNADINVAISDDDAAYILMRLKAELSPASSVSESAGVTKKIAKKNAPTRRTRGYKLYPCSECTYSARDLCDLEKHQWTHLKRPYYCPNCRYKATLAGSIAQHVRYCCPEKAITYQIRNLR